MAIQYLPSGTTARQLAASVEEAIRRGVLRPGDTLPAVRLVAAERGVSPSTVAAAYRELGQRALVVGRGRAGTQVAGAPPLRVPMSPEVPEGVRDLTVGGPDPALLPPVPRTGRVTHLYGEPSVDPVLRRLADRDLVADGIDAANLAVVGGALDGIERVLTAWLVPGATVAVEDPGFAPVLHLLAALRLQVVPMAVDDQGIRPDALAAVLEGGCDAVVCTPRAANPTGSAWDGDRRDELGSVLEGHPGVLVVEDDHAGPVAGTPGLTVNGGRQRWATVRSVSKSLGPDYRLAVLAGDETTVARVEGRQSLGTGWVSHLLQDAVAHLWADPATAARLDRAAARYAARRAALAAALADQGIAATGRSGLTTWVPVADEHGVVAGLAGLGWAVLPGERFRVASGPGIRIAFSSLGEDEAPRLAADLASCLRRRPVRTS